MGNSTRSSSSYHYSADDDQDSGLFYGGQANHNQVRIKNVMQEERFIEQKGCIYYGWDQGAV